MEDFPFPCLQLEQCNNARTLPFPHFASPSPWRVAGSSVGTAGHEHEHHRRSCSAVEPHQAAAACSDRHTMAVAAGRYQHHHGSARYAAEEDRMDMLWEEYFNEELLAMRRRAGGGSCSSDGDESDVSAAGRGAPVGCFPVLRPSARAGGAGHYRRRADTWVLLMRIFRRLFVVDKTVSPPAAARRSATKSAR